MTQPELPPFIPFFIEFKKQLGFELPNDVAYMFQNFRDRYNGNILVEQKQRLSPSRDGQKDWYMALANAMGNCAGQAGQCLYHLENLIRLENLAITLVKKHNPAGNSPSNVGMALSAEKLDYEFHALTVAIKTYISYVATVAHAFFKQEKHTFDGYKKSLKKAEPTTFSAKVVRLLDEHWPRLSMFYSVGTRKSVRDTLLHYKYIGAGWINIYGGSQNISAAMAMPQEVLRNAVIEPDFKPHELEKSGLGPARLMSDQTSYVLTLSAELFRVLGLYEPKSKKFEER